MNLQKGILPALLIFCVCLNSFAQTITSKPKNTNEMVGRILHEQKTWQLKQLPTNSVLYKFNSRYVTPFYQSPKVSPLPFKSNIINSAKGTFMLNSFKTDSILNKKFSLAPFNRRFLVIKPLNKN